MEASTALPAPAHAETNGSAGAVTVASPAMRIERDVQAETFEIPRGPRLSGALLTTLAAITGLAAIGLGLWAFVTSVRAEDRVRLVRPPSSEAAQAISFLSKPTTARLPFSAGDGRLILAVGPNGRAMLVLDGLGLAPVGRRYQAWVLSTKSRSDPLPAATFIGSESVVPLSAKVAPGFVVGITVERADGAKKPTKSLKLIAQRPVGQR
jgi:hypothetical protein